MRRFFSLLVLAAMLTGLAGCGQEQTQETVPEEPLTLESLAVEISKNGLSTERLLQAKRECAEAGRYGYIVVNDDPDKAARELDAIITAEKCKMADRIKLVTEVLIS